MISTYNINIIYDGKAAKGSTVLNIEHTTVYTPLAKTLRFRDRNSNNFPDFFLNRER